MTLEQFRESLLNNQPPETISAYLKSMWYDAKGDWAEAHNIVQDMGDKKAAWIHAYLHRKEGDIWNADYWYSRADKSRPDCSLQEEWNDMVKSLV